MDRNRLGTQDFISRFSNSIAFIAVKLLKMKTLRLKVWEYCWILHWKLRMLTSGVGVTEKGKTEQEINSSWQPLVSNKLVNVIVIILLG